MLQSNTKIPKHRCVPTLLPNKGLTLWAGKVCASLEDGGGNNLLQLPRASAVCLPEGCTVQLRVWVQHPVSKITMVLLCATLVFQFSVLSMLDQE